MKRKSSTLKKKKKTVVSGGEICFKRERAFTARIINDKGKSGTGKMYSIKGRFALWKFGTTEKNHFTGWTLKTII